MADLILKQEDPNTGSTLNVENSMNIQGFIVNEDAPETNNTKGVPKIPETTYDSNKSRPSDDHDRKERNERNDRKEREHRRRERRRSEERDRRRSHERSKKHREREERRKQREKEGDSYEELDDEDRKMMEQLANPEKKKREEPPSFDTKNDDDDAEEDEYPPDFARDRSDRHDRNKDSHSPKRHSTTSPKKDFRFEDDSRWAYDEPRLSPEEELRKKQEILEGFDKLSRKGVRIHRVFDINSDLREMEGEYNRLIKQREIENSIKFQRKMLMAFVTGIEFLNNRYNPFDLDLDGWSEVVMADIDGYDDIFEELYEKYHTKVNMAPELRLMFTLGGSAVMFHLTNTMFKSALPGANPQMAKNMQKMAMNAMRGGLGGNGNQQQQQQGGNPMGNMFGMFGGPPGPGAANMPVPPRNPVGPRPGPAERSGHIRVPQPGINRPTQRRSSGGKRREMRGPKNADLDDILNDLNLPDNGGIDTDIEALLNSDESEQETKHISLKTGGDNITLKGRSSN